MSTRAKRRSSVRPVSKSPSFQLPPGQRVWLLDVPFDERGYAAKSGARWDAALRATVYTGTSLPDALKPYESAPFSWERWREDDVNSSQGSLPRSERRFTPRPHQLEARDAIQRAAAVGARGFLLADDVGLGKTISAVLGVESLKRSRPVRNVLIVCPLAVVAHWRRTLADLGAGEDGTRYCVINYDRLKKLLDVPASAQQAKRTRTRNARVAKDGKPLVQWDVVVADEAHKLKNPAAQRSQAFATVARYSDPRDTAPFVLWVSATAAQTVPEISYLAPLLAQVTRSTKSSLRDFGSWLQQHGFHVEKEARFGGWQWTDDTSEREQDISHLRQLVFERKTPLALRRRPSEISGWPEINRILLPIELTSEQSRLYKQAWTEFRREMNLARKGRDPKVGMVARLRFRQKASLLRVDGTIEQAVDLIDNNHQVAISVQFLESLDVMEEKFGKRGISVSVMDGRDPGQRESERLRFQRGETSVCLFTVEEGISLHQNELLPDGVRATNVPRALLIHDARYSGISTLQIEGRTHRDGQAANAWYLFGSGTAEEDVVRALLARINSTQAIAGDDRETVRALEAMLEGRSP